MRRSLALTAAAGLAAALLPLTAAQAADEQLPGEVQVTIPIEGSLEDSGSMEGAFVSIVVSGDTPIDVGGELVPPGSVVAGGVADELGELTVDLPPGDYTIVAAKPGFQPDSVDLTVPESGEVSVPTVTLPDNERPMDFVNAFGAQVTAVLTDGEPGVFYATTSSIPSFYRTTDFGGTWAPVVVSSDAQGSADTQTPFKGLDGRSVVSDITTSGYPGEVAVYINGIGPGASRTLWYSRDFGTTWQSTTLPNQLTSIRDIQWAHGYDEAEDEHSSYLFILTGGVDSPSTTMWAAIMPSGTAGSADSPETAPAVTISQLATSYLSSSTDLFTARAGADSVYVAVQMGEAGTQVFEVPQGATSTSELVPGRSPWTIEGLTRTTQTSPFNNYTDLLLFGGRAHPITGMPMSLVVYNRTGVDRNSPRGTLTATQLDESGEWGGVASSVKYYNPISRTLTSRSSFGDPSFTQDNCGENETTPVGSLAPVLAGEVNPNRWDGFGTMGMFRQCLLVVASGTGSLPVGGGQQEPPTPTEIPSGTIVVIPASGANNNTGSAFSAGFDLTTDSVVISGDGARGLVKAATFQRSAADLPPDQGGLSVKALSEEYGYTPLFPATAHVALNYINNRADAGADPTSGGFAVNGITSPTVRDLAPSPTDPDGMLMGLSFTGGGRTLLSADGGERWFTIGGGGSNAVTWWSAANGDQWLAGGSSGDSQNSFFSATRVTAEEWTAYKDAVAAGEDPDSPTFRGSRITFPQPASEFGASSFNVGGGELAALAGIGGTDKVLVGASGNNAGTVAIATVSQGQGGITVGNVGYLGSSPSFTWSQSASAGPTAGSRLRSIQYCPSAAADADTAPAVQDTAFAVFESEVLRIDNVSGQSPAVSEVDLGSASARDVKMDCDSGAVVIATRPATQGPDAHLLISAPATPDGELAPFEAVEVIAGAGGELPPGIGTLETVAVEVEGDEAILLLGGERGDVVVVEAALDDLTSGEDLSGSTVNDVSDPADFAFGNESVGDLEFPTQESEAPQESVSRRARAAAATTLAMPLLGAGAGALETSVPAPSAATAPGEPTSVTALGGWSAQASSATVKVDWQPPSSDGGSAITGYEISYRRSPSGQWSTPVERTANARTITINDLLAGTTYDVRVAAINAVDTGAAAGAQATTPTTPGVPRSVEAKASWNTQAKAAKVTVTWVNPTSTGGSAITGYKIQYRAGSSGTWESVPGTRPAGLRSFDIPGLKSGRTYEVRVAAVNVVGTGAFSAASRATTPSTPGAPTGVSGKASGKSPNARISLSWKAGAANGSAITGYAVEQQKGSKWVEVATTKGATTVDIPGKFKKGNYSFRVRATNAVGTSDWASGSASVKS